MSAIFFAILAVLKTVFFILLAIVAVILIIILALLLIPFFYSGRFKYNGNPDSCIKLNWMLFIIRLNVQYKDDLSFCLRLFGIPLFRSDHIKRTSHKKKKKNNDSDTEKAQESIDADKSPESEADSFDDLNDLSQSEDHSDNVVTMSSSEENEPSPQNDHDYSSDASKRKRFTNPFIWLKKRISLIFQQIRTFVKRIITSLKSLNSKKEDILTAIKDPANIRLIRFLFQKIKKLLHILLPKKIYGMITFGFEDPYTTGKVLSYMAMFYPAYGRKLSVTPVFDRKEICADINMRGSFSLLPIIIILIQILRNKDFRQFRRKSRGKNGR